MIVRELMITGLITVAPNDTLSHATNLLRRYQFHHLPVVRAANAPEAGKGGLQYTNARQLVMPLPIRQAFPAPLRHSPMEGISDLLHVQGSATPSRSKVLKTFKGTLLLRDFCPPSLVEHLRADSGLTAFAHLPEREHDLLLTVAKSPDCALTLAHTPAGEIVGQVTLAPGNQWWGELANVYEVAIEVSSNWRSS